MFADKTPINVMPPGYKPDLDRLPQQGSKGIGRGCAWITVLLVALSAICGGVYMVIASQQNNTEVITSDQAIETLLLVPTTTISHTATHTITIVPTDTATLDYCWFLTPTAEILPTIYVTPDTAQLRATDDSYQTGTPTFTPYPTQPPPMAWCDNPPASETPLPTDTITPTIDVVNHATDIPILITPTSISTSTIFPTLVPREPVGSQPDNFTAPTGVPQLVVETVIVVQTQINVKVVTATKSPATKVPTQKPSNTPTLTLTTAITGTATHTATFTATPTDTATSTHTPTATHTPTHTATFTATPTDTATSTHTPTATHTPTIELTSEVTIEVMP